MDRIACCRTPSESESRAKADWLYTPESNVELDFVSLAGRWLGSGMGGRREVTCFGLPVSNGQDLLKVVTGHEAGIHRSGFIGCSQRRGAWALVNAS